MSFKRKTFEYMLHQSDPWNIVDRQDTAVYTALLYFLNNYKSHSLYKLRSLESLENKAAPMLNVIKYLKNKFVYGEDISKAYLLAEEIYQRTVELADFLKGCDEIKELEKIEKEIEDGYDLH